MAGKQLRPWTWSACLGRNGWDEPTNVPDDMGQEALNVEFLDGSLGQKRRGTTVVVPAGVTLSSGIYQLFSFTPFSDLTQAQLWILTAETPPKFYAVGPATNIPPMTDPLTGHPNDVSAVAMNGKLFIAYQSGINRLHVHDPRDGLASPIRQCGMASPAAPTVAADTTVGTSTLRYYRIGTFVENASGVITRRSQLGPSVAFTPSNTGAIVTRPATFPDGATHWQVYASTDDAVYYELSPILPVATTTYQDDVDPVNYNAGDPAPLEGDFTPFPSVRYVASDGIHLFGLGVWETSAGTSLPPISGRVYFSPAIGTSDFGDDERVQNTVDTEGYIDVAPNGGGIDRGIAGPLNDRMFAFQANMIVMLVPTGQASQPFARIVLSRVDGAVSHRSIIMGEDEYGQPCLYFLNPRDGPRRIALGRTIEWLGRDVNDIWRTINLDSGSSMHGTYDAARKLVLWFVCTTAAGTGANQVPDMMIVYNVALGRASTQGIRYGWAKWNGNLASSGASVMFSTVIASGSNRSEWLSLYASCANHTLLRQDGPPNATDSYNPGVDTTGAPYQTLIKSRVWPRGALLYLTRQMRAVIAGRNTGANLQITVEKDWGAVVRTDIAVMSPPTGTTLNTPTHVRVNLDAIDVADAAAVAIQITDINTGLQPITPLSLDTWSAADELEAGTR